jgi:NAD(P)-dependent dehydrogenase (short-subunit alcohol dehydrogenase family)
MLKTIVMTGATNGIGRIVAASLAAQGHHLVLIARNEAKADATRSQILQDAPSASIDLYLADFARLQTVVAAAQAVAARYQRIDVLINNAGIHAFQQRVTEDGFSEMVSVNYLAPWLLTKILSPRLAATAPSRIVTVASEASRHAKEVKPQRDLHDTSPFARLGSSVIYGRTKLMNIMFSMELSRRLASTAVTANCLDPGFNVTGLGRELPFAASIERLLGFLRIGDPNRGAGIIMRLAMDSEFENISGRYFSVKDATPISPAPPGNDVEAQKALWAATEAALRTISPA